MDFWKTIEYAWEEYPTLHELRSMFVLSHEQELLPELMDGMNQEIVDVLAEKLSTFSATELTQFNRTMEAKLYHLDREELNEYMEGDAEDFLYSRCFVIAMGEKYFRLIDQDPSMAPMARNGEKFGFVGYKVYRELFGTEFERCEIHDIETGSNKAGWS